MKRPGRRGLLIIIISIIVIGGGIFVTWQLIQSALKPPPVATPPPPITEKVLVTSRGLARGAVLAPGDLKIVDIPVELVPLTRLNRKNQAVGKEVVMPMVAGEMVLPHHLVNPSNVIDRNLAFTLEEDQVLLAFPILDLMSNLNILKKGDLIDILVTKQMDVQAQGALLGPGEVQSQPYTFDSLQRITITAIVMDIVEGQQPAQQPAQQPVQQAEKQAEAALTPGPEPTATPKPPPEPSRHQTRPVAIMLALDPQDALVLKHLKDTGATFDIVLRSPTSEEFFETTPVTSEFIIERYLLQTIE